MTESTDHNYTTVWQGRANFNLTTMLMFVLALFLFEAFMVEPLSATTKRTGSRAKIGPELHIEDDLLITAGDCKIDGSVDGDVLAFAKDFRLRGSVSGAAIVAAQESSIDGEILHSLGSFSQKAFVSGTIHGSAYMFAEKIEIDEEALFMRDASLFCDSLFMGGTVSGELNCYVGYATISGSIGKDLEITTDKPVRIFETANIGGDLIIHGNGELDIDDGAIIAGEIVRLENGDSESDGFSIGGILGSLYLFTAFYILALVILAVSRRHFHRSSQAIKKETFRSFAFGLIAYIIGFFVTVALAITIVGLITSMVIFTALFIVMFLLGPIYVAAGIGGWVLPANENPGYGSYAVRVLIGLILLSLSTEIPIAGLGIYLVAAVTGLGAFILGVKSCGSTEDSSGRELAQVAERTENP